MCLIFLFLIVSISAHKCFPACHLCINDEDCCYSGCLYKNKSDRYGTCISDRYISIHSSSCWPKEHICVCPDQCCTGVCHYKNKRDYYGTCK